MPTSPNSLNYFIGKGTLSWTPDGGAARDLGNAPEVEVTPNQELLPHYSSRTGIRKKDREVATLQEMSIRIVLDEITPENLQLLLMGDDPVVNTAGNKEFNMFARAELPGSLIFTGTNEVGNQVVVTMPKISFRPSSGLSLISDEWGQIEITAEVLADEVTGEFGTVETIEVAVPT